MNLHVHMLTSVCAAFRLLYGSCTLSFTCTHSIKDVSVQVIISVQDSGFFSLDFFYPTHLSVRLYGVRELCRNCCILLYSTKALCFTAQNHKQCWSFSIKEPEVSLEFFIMAECRTFKRHMINHFQHVSLLHKHHQRKEHCDRAHRGLWKYVTFNINDH